MAQKTTELCPRCYTPGLVFSDDPNQEGWGSSGEWRCPKCGYWATDHMLEMDQLDEGDDDDWDYEDDFEDDDDIFGDEDDDE